MGGRRYAETGGSRFHRVAANEDVWPCSVLPLTSALESVHPGIRRMFSPAAARERQVPAPGQGR